MKKKYKFLFRRKVVLVIGVFNLLNSILFCKTDFDMFAFFFIIAFICFIYSRRIIYRIVAKPIIVRVSALKDKENTLNRNINELKREIVELENKKYSINKSISGNKSTLDEINRNKQKINRLLTYKNQTEKNMIVEESKLKNSISVLNERKKMVEQFIEQENIIFRAIEDKKEQYNVLDQRCRDLNDTIKNTEYKLQEYNKYIQPLQAKKDFYKKCNLEYIDNLDGLGFEEFTAELLRNLGYNNVEVTDGSGDYGIDVIAEKDNIRYALQCKNYARPVGNKAIQETYSGKSYYNSHVAIVITNNYFTSSAINQANANNIVLWDRDKLEELIKTLTK